MSLKELAARIEELESILKQEADGLEGGQLVALSGAKTNASAELELLSLQYKQALAGSLEFVLIKGPGEAAATENLDKAGAVVVDAQNIYKLLSESVKDLVPTTGLHTEAFARLVMMTRNLQVFTGAILQTGLTHTPDDPSKSLEENARTLTRSQLGGAGLEPLAVLMDSVLLAYNKRVSKAPVIVAVTNVLGATEADYSKYLKSVNSFTFETGDVPEVKSMIKLLKQKLVAQSKMKETESETKQEGASNGQ